MYGDVEINENIAYIRSKPGENDLIPQPGIRYLVNNALAVLFFLVLGLGFKETAVMLPVIIAVYDYLFLAKSKIRNIRIFCAECWPFRPTAKSAVPIST